ncbi:unnamed protein product [Effrenium voratum]|nr:unnamed protein product [Effrenium voratum]
MKAAGASAMLEKAGIAPGKLDPEVAAAIRRQAEEMMAAEAARKAPVEQEEIVTGPSFLLREGCKVILTGLVSKPENNGKQGSIVRFLDDQQKYQVSLEGKLVKLKPENVEAAEDPPPKRSTLNGFDS